MKRKSLSPMFRLNLGIAVCLTIFIAGIAFAADTQAPSVPTGLTATAIFSSQINLSWTASTDNVGVTGYKIYRGGVQIGTSATNSYPDTGLSPSTTHSYTVSAYDAAGNNSAQSTAASATTQSSGSVIYYVLAGGAGNHNGADWSNANCKIPSNLAPGDIVYIGNSGGNLADTTTTCAGEASHVFNTSGTSGNHITIKAATGSDHGTATGWQASYGGDVNPKITWSNTFVPANGIKSPFWDFCGSYYDINGKVGAADSTGSYGFYFKSAGQMFGFIRADSHACSQASITDLTFKNVELDGVEANSINGFGGAAGFYMGSPVSTTATVNNISIQYFFVHDLFAPFGAEGRMTGLTLTNGWVYTNFSNSAAHSQGLEVQAGGGPHALNNLTVANTVWKNIQGTAVIVCLSGSCDAWKIYNNIFYYSSNWDAVCERGDATAACQISKVVGDNNGSQNPLTNLTFYGNTIANIHIKPGHSGGDNAGIVITATGSQLNEVRNNLWYNCDEADIYYDGLNGRGKLVSHDSNTWVNTNFSTSAMTLSPRDFQVSTKTDPTQACPFVSDGTGNFHLSSEVVNPHLNDGTPLAGPYNLDFDGNIRGADGTWDRGAYEYVPAILYGDVSENGSVSAYDASLASQYAVGLITLTSTQITKADVSGNSSVSAYDASLIAQKAVGLIDKFPVEG